MQSESVTLGGRNYVLVEQAVRPGKAFREALKIHFGSLLDLVKQAPDLDVNDAGTVSSLVELVGLAVLDSTEIFIELLFTFSPQLEKDREFLLDNAVGSEIVDAFIAILYLTFPFLESQRLRALFTAAQSVGLRTPKIGTSSASVNGDSGQTKLTTEPSSS